MGCNSHLAIEYRRPGWNHWSTYAIDVEESRDYGLYGFMAGVRAWDVEPIVPPRGLPKDMYYSTKKFFEEGGTDFHTPTWLTAEEYSECIKRLVDARKKASEESKKTWGDNIDFIDKPWLILEKVLKILVENYRDVRLIVAFDN